MGHLAGSLAVLCVYCVVVCAIVGALAKRASRKLRESGAVGRMLVGDIDKGQAVTGPSGVSAACGKPTEAAARPLILAEAATKTSLLQQGPLYHRKKSKGLFISAVEAVRDLARIILMSPPKHKRRKRFDTIA